MPWCSCWCLDHDREKVFQEKKAHLTGTCFVVVPGQNVSVVAAAAEASCRVVAHLLTASFVLRGTLVNVCNNNCRQCMSTLLLPSSLFVGTMMVLNGTLGYSGLFLAMVLLTDRQTDTHTHDSLSLFLSLSHTHTHTHTHFFLSLFTSIYIHRRSGHECTACSLLCSHVVIKVYTIVGYTFSHHSHMSRLP